jgi:type IV pilus assembly protein PilM
MPAGPTVGLDIGSHAIKVAEVVPGRAGITVKALGIAPTPEGAIENSVVVDPKLLGEAVKRLLKESGIGTKTCISSVSGQGALVVRVIEVPKMTDSALADQMRWEVERHVPFAANDVIMDFQPIVRPGTPDDAQNMDVLLAVAQQDMIDRHVETLVAAGLKPTAVDVEPLAASRALVELADDAYENGKTYLIVNIGANNTDLGIIQNGLIAFPRTLPLAGDAMTKAIAAVMSLSDEEAESLKIQSAEVLSGSAQPAVAAPAGEGFMDFSLGETAPTPAPTPERGPFDYSEEPDTAPIPEEAAAASTTDAPSGTLPVPVEATDSVKAQLYSAIAPTLTELLSEIRRSMEYYRGRTPDAVIDEILLCGGGAKLKSLAQLLTDDLGIPARVASPFKFTQVTARNLSAEYLESVAPEFVVAVGLAVRDMVAVPAPPTAGRKRGKK